MPFVQKVAGGRQVRTKVGGFQFTETRVAAAGTVVCRHDAKDRSGTGGVVLNLVPPITGGRTFVIEGLTMSMPIPK